MPTTLQLIVHRSMGELEWLIQYLKKSCVRYLGRTHSPDEGCERTHSHFAIQYKYTKQALSKFLNSNGINGSENYGILSRCEKSKKPYDFDKLSIYILKGIIDETVRYNGIAEDTCKTYREQWNDYKKDIESGKTNPTPRVYDEWEEIKRDGIKHFEESKVVNFDFVRKFVMQWYWKRSGRLPHPASYKRNAASLYYHLTQLGFGCSSIALDEIMDKWY